MLHSPWTSGPRELLDHAHDHLTKGSDFDHRIAMISVDNAVELMLKTYIDLPNRVTGLSLTRRQRNEYTADFPSALAAVEGLVPDRLSGINLGEIEWFHRSRNRLYHDSDATTVGRHQVEGYLKHAERLIQALFGPASPLPPSRGGKLTEPEFMALLERNAGPDAVRVARRLIDDLQSMGLQIDWKQASFSAKLADPGGSGRRFTMLLLTKQGQVTVGWLPGQLEQLGHPEGIGLGYYEQAAQLFNNCEVKRYPTGGYTWSRGIPVSELDENYDQFLEILSDTIDRIRAAAQAQEQQAH
jgi:hypothetical protein